MKSPASATSEHQTLHKYYSVADPQNAPTDERRSPTGQPMPSVVAQNCNPLPWTEQHATMGYDSTDGLPVIGSK